MSGSVHDGDGEPIGGDKDRLPPLFEGLSLQLDMAMLLFNLLAWQYLPERRGDRCRDDITVQRHKAAICIRAIPDLMALFHAAWWWDGVWSLALEIAEEKGVQSDAFPASCPWGFAQVLDMGFWPSPVGDA
jgi:hypothetical protein